MYAQRIHTRLKVTIFISNTRIKALRHYSLPASSSPFSLFSSFCLKMEMKMWVGMVVMVCLFNIHIECKSILDNAQDAQLLCYFIFGDSLADNGNNNNLETKAKVDYFPYGIDYSDGHIGRFTNGRTIVDIIAELLGFKHHIPAFAATFNTSVDILTGVNYASGSAGILEETGKHLGTNIDLDRQLENHKIIVDGITELLKNQNLSPAMYLNKCLYSVGMGNNDYLNNYFMP
ncbi:GDSL esterase/lipase At1g29660-like, partial [Carica papaya]|uniref:GDSL esterase/lipase At1g29660-like n=1 Tax=Carica papaya TaxID=3649 RepID=UPI000B8CF4EC